MSVKFSRSSRDGHHKVNICNVSIGSILHLSSPYACSSVPEYRLHARYLLPTGIRICECHKLHSSSIKYVEDDAIVFIHE